MTRMIVLFNLKPGVDPGAYEVWARDRDAVSVRALHSIDSFTVTRIDGAMGRESPFQYVELIEINDMSQFETDVATDNMTAVAAEFQEWADDPVFIYGEEII